MQFEPLRESGGWKVRLSLENHPMLLGRGGTRGNLWGTLGEPGELREAAQMVVIYNGECHDGCSYFSWLLRSSRHQTRGRCKINNDCIWLFWWVQGPQGFLTKPSSGNGMIFAGNPRSTIQGMFFQRNGREVHWGWTWDHGWPWMTMDDHGIWWSHGSIIRHFLREPRVNLLECVEYPESHSPNMIHDGRYWQVPRMIGYTAQGSTRVGGSRTGTHGIDVESWWQRTRRSQGRTWTFAT